jgi:hypothetical protein
MKRYLIGGLLFVVTSGVVATVNGSGVKQNSYDPLVADPARAFTLIVLPDTQKYTESYPDTFCVQTDWIVKNKEKMNIKFVSQLGDIVENGGKFKNEWETASRCMGKLDGVVPYGLVPGNHDMEKENSKRSGYASYNSNFPISRFANYPWYKAHYKENQNNAELVSSHGVDLLFINLEPEPSDAVLYWAELVAKQYPDAYAIVTTHKYLPDGKSDKRDTTVRYGRNGNSGQEVWEKLVSKQCNIKMVLSGHYHLSDGEKRIQGINKCGYRVEEIMQDYQGREFGGNGKLRIYTFVPEEKRILVSTYSPLTNTFEKDADSLFELKLRK